MSRNLLALVAFVSLIASQAAGASPTGFSAGSKAFVVGEFNIKDPAAYDRFKAAIGPIVAKSGGRYLARAGRIGRFAGVAPTGLVVVIEFDSFARAAAFEQSAENQAIAPLRRQAADSRIFIVEGVAP